MRTLVVSPSFVASIAQALNSAQVPCALWGHCLLRVHGVPTIISSIDFIVPDDQLQVSIEVLKHIKTLSPCLQGDLCPSSPQQRYSQSPSFHIHVDDSLFKVSLFTHSETIWFLPPLHESLSTPEEAELPPEFFTASDHTVLPPSRPGRAPGVYPPNEYPVLVLRAHVLLEALMRVYARDVGTRVGSAGMAHLTYIDEYVDDDGLLDTELIPEPLRTFYMELKQGTKPVRQWTEDLKAALEAEKVSSANVERKVM